MKVWKTAAAILTLACMLLGLCACGEAEQPQDSTPSTEVTESQTPETQITEQETEAEDGKVTYTVKVQDENGDPIANAMVQFCLESCMPVGATDAQGMVTCQREAADYKVSLMQLPEGYDYSTDTTEFYFDNGALELTIVLKAN